MRIHYFIQVKKGFKTKISVYFTGSLKKVRRYKNAVTFLAITPENFASVIFKEILRIQVEKRGLLNYCYIYYIYIYTKVTALCSEFSTIITS